MTASDADDGIEHLFEIDDPLKGRSDEAEPARLTDWLVAGPEVTTRINNVDTELDEIFYDSSSDSVVKAQPACERISWEARQMEKLIGPGQPARWSELIDHIESTVEACRDSDVDKTKIERRKAAADLDAVVAEIKETR